MQKFKNWVKEHKVELAVEIGGLVIFMSGVLLGYGMGKADGMSEAYEHVAENAHEELTKLLAILEDCPELADLEIRHF